MQLFTHNDIKKIDSLIDNCITEYFSINNMDLHDYSFRTSIRHNEVRNILRYINNNIFYTDRLLINNQNCLIDYSDVILFEYLYSKFLYICNYFNKALGLDAFAVLLGVNDQRIQEWLGDELNPERQELLRNIAEFNKNTLVDNLKETTLGAIAVANNDKPTGLQWGKNKAPTVEKQSVFFIPSERIDRLRIDQNDNEV